MRPCVIHEHQNNVHRTVCLCVHHVISCLCTTSLPLCVSRRAWVTNGNQIDVLALQVSGARFWGFLKKYCEKPEVLFKHSYVHNICPLVFMNKTGRNLTPPDLRAAERKPLIEVCHRYLVEVVRLLGVSIIIGVGKFAQREAKAALDEAGIRGIKVESIMHPSPANPAANRGWEDVVHKELEELDVLRFLGTWS